MTKRDLRNIRIGIMIMGGLINLIVFGISAGTVPITNLLTIAWSIFAFSWFVDIVLTFLKCGPVWWVHAITAAVITAYLHIHFLLLNPYGPGTLAIIWMLYYCYLFFAGLNLLPYTDKKPAWKKTGK